MVFQLLTADFNVLVIASVQSTRPCLKFKTAMVLNLRLVKSEKIFSFMYQVLRSRYAKSSTMMVKLCSMIKKNDTLF